LKPVVGNTLLSARNKDTKKDSKIESFIQGVSKRALQL
jgi:hypothetical protein